MEKSLFSLVFPENIMFNNIVSFKNHENIFSVFRKMWSYMRYKGKGRVYVMMRENNFYLSIFRNYKVKKEIIFAIDPNGLALKSEEFFHKELHLTFSKFLNIFQIWQLLKLKWMKIPTYLPVALVFSQCC